ncbi:MAG: hypothetical protein WBQ62_04555 [Dehalococcoidales bacterium]|jgi:hypothetical protein
MKLVQHHQKIIAVAMALIVFSAIMLQLAGCGGSSAKTTAAATTTQAALGNQTTTTAKTTTTTAAKTTTTAATANVNVPNSDGTVSVSAPSGWNLNDLGLYPNAVIGVANDANSEYLIVTKKAKTDVGANSTVTDYLNLVKSVFGLVVTNGVWGQTSNVTIGGCSGISVQLTGTRNSNGVSTVYYINVVASKDYYYNICGYTDASLAAANQAQLEAIIKSFKETN